MFRIAFLVFLATVNSQFNHVRTETEDIKLVFITEDPPEDVKKDLAPIIMLHGMTDDKQTWLVVAPIIAKNTGRKIYMLDARNHGDSPWSDDFDFDILANDVDHFMTEHNIPKAVVVGHSMGARTAMVLALTKPDRVEMAILEDMSTADVGPEKLKPMLELFRGLRHIITLIPSSADETTARKFIVDMIMKSLDDKVKEKVTEQQIEDLAKRLSIKKKDGRWVWKPNFEVLEKFVKTGNTKLQHEGQYAGAALFIYGLESEFTVGDTTDHIKKYFPNAEFIGVQAGHLIHNPLPKIFSDAVIKFINAH